MKKQFTYLMSLLCLLVCGTNGLFAQTATIGLTQTIDETNKKFGNKVWSNGDLTGLTVETLKTEYCFHASSDGGKDFYLNGTATANKYKGYEYWRKNTPTTDYVETQYCGFKITIPSGKKISINNVDVRAIVSDDMELNWKVVVVNGEGTKLFTSDAKKSKRAESQSLTCAVTGATDLTSSAEVRLYVWQNGSSKYFLTDKLLAEVTFSDDLRTTYDLTTSVSPAGAGTVSPAGTSSVPEGSNVVLTATPNAGYKFVNWTIDDSTTETSNPLTLSNVTANHTAIANFDVLPVITFAKPTDPDVYAVNRFFPQNINTKDVGETITLPLNYIYYKEGYTMTAWTDGETEVAPGGEYTVVGNATLSPVFTENTVSIATRTKNADVTYNFATSTNGGRLVNIEGNADKVITTATIDGKTIDVAINVDCNTGASGLKDDKGNDRKGKLNNLSRTGGAQCNIGTVFTIPVVKGSKVEIFGEVAITSADAFTFDGEPGKLNSTTDSKNKRIYARATADGTMNVICTVGSMYVEKIAISYPVDQKVSVTSAGYATFCPSAHVSIPEGVEAFYIASEGVSDGKATLTKITSGKIALGEGVILKGAVDNYTFPVVGETVSKISGNQLVGTLSETSLADESAYILANGTKGVGLYLCSAGKIDANKAYLPKSAVAGAPVALAFALDEEATSINQTMLNSQEPTAVYNLAGQKVSSDFRGIVIKNGKKICVK